MPEVLPPNNSINAPLPISSTQGGMGLPSPTLHGIVVAQGTFEIETKVLTNGQLLIGSTGADPVAASLTAGTGITVTPGAGSLTLSSTNGAGTVWSSITTSTKNPMVANEGYISNYESGVGYKLPTSVTFGTIFEITGPQLYAVSQNDGQSIRLGSLTTTVGVSGFIASTNAGDTLRMVCNVATPGAEQFIVIGGVGAFTVN